MVEESCVCSELPSFGGTLDSLDGVCWMFCFTKLDTDLVFKCMTKDGGIFARSVLLTQEFGVLPP